MKLSIIIPNFNKTSQEIILTIRSVENIKRRENLEVIFIDDFSDYHNFTIFENIIKKSSLKDPKLIRHEKNKGLGEARNTGILNSSNKYLTFLDCGDQIADDIIVKSTNYLDEKDYDVIVAKLKLVRKAKITSQQYDIITNFYKKNKSFYFQRLLNLQIPNQATAKIIKKKFLLENNLFFLKKNLFHEDLYFVPKLLTSAEDFRFIHDIYYTWNKENDSISETFTKKHIDDFNEINKILNQDFDNSTLLNRASRFFHIKIKSYKIKNFKDIFNFIWIFNYIFKNTKGKKFKIKLFLSVYVKFEIFLRNIFLRNSRFRNQTGLSKVFKNFSKFQNSIGLLNLFILVTFQISLNILIKLVRALRKIKFISKKKKKNFISIKDDIDDNEREKLKTLHNKFSGKRCFIIGNGPSLNKINLDLLKDEYTFGVNSIFYKFYENKFLPTFFTVEDDWVMRDRQDEINRFDVPFKFIPARYKNMITNFKNVYFYPMNKSFYMDKIPKFSKLIYENVYSGQTVTYTNFQIASYLGFKKIYMIGMDFDYVKPAHVIESGNIWLSTGDDPNHFHKDYFGSGKRWKDPQLDQVLRNYKNAHKFFQEQEVEIYNATVGGKLEEFPRVDFNSLF